DRLDARHECRVDRERRLDAGVITPPHGQPNGREACGGRLVDEVVGDGQSPRTFGGRLEHVTEVDATADRGRGSDRVRRCARWRVVRHWRVFVDVGNTLGGWCSAAGAPGACAEDKRCGGDQGRPYGPEAHRPAYRNSITNTRRPAPCFATLRRSATPA